MKQVDSPFNIVFERNLEAVSVIKTPRTITSKRTNAHNSEFPNDELTPPIRNIVIIAISVGKRPLHGTKEFVSIAIIRSLGDDIILQPITPQALHPKPIHIVSAAFPSAPDFLKNLSRLNATLGR